MDNLDGLSPDQKRQLLVRLLREKSTAAEATYPLSYGQRGLWFLHQLASDSAVYNEAYVWRMSADLDVTLLRAGLQAAIDRHPVMRTIYADSGDGPVQIVQPSQPVAFTHTDATGWTPQQLQDRLSEEARRPFDLDKGPVMRFHLFSLSTREHVLLSTAHHIAIDLWSTILLMGELQVVYETLRAGRRLQLPAPRATYRDFVNWQEQQLTGTQGEADWVYWAERLSGELPDLQLPTDRPRPTYQTYRGEAVPLQLSVPLTEQVKNLGREEQTTLFGALLAGIYTLLYRLTGQQDIVVGSMGAGRSKPEFEEVVGYFANLLPLRADLSGRPTFRSLLRQVRETVLAGIQHQDFPFPLLVQRLLPNRDPSRPPLCNVLIQLNAHQADLFRDAERLDTSSSPGRLAMARVGNTMVELMQLDQPIAKVDICFILYQTAGAIAGRIEYNTDLFDRQTIGRMAEYWVNLLQAAVSEPDRSLATLPVMSQSERTQLLRQSNDTAITYPRDACVHRLFEAQAAKTPDAVALAWNGQELSYGELNRRANQLAHYLQALGVGPEVLVGVCLERSVEMIVAWMAVLKAGGAYLPLDPDYPLERLAYLLTDSRAPLLVTVEKLMEALPSSQAKLVCLDRDAEAITACSEENPVSRAVSGNLAYVVYTSGSTGKPKGIAIIHYAISRLVLNTNYISFGPTDRVAQASNASFDLSTFEIWGALLNGACLVGIPKLVVLSPPDLSEELRRQRVSVLILPTALFNQVARTVPLAFHSVKNLLFGGEVVEPQWVKTVLQAGPPQRLLHVYGPTEITTLATSHVVTRIPEGAETVSIGVPIANTEVYVLDDNLELAPTGVVGELFLGGDGLARGYVNQPDLTAERFVPDPFSDKPGARLYRTGDRVRWRADGTLEFVGRLDFQVKLRGFRIELPEVEGALGQHVHVAQAVAVVREDHPGDKRLVAYVVPKNSTRLDLSGLRRFLRSKLPEYMMPSAFVVLDTLPLNPNGKLDRSALPVPGSERPDLAESFVAPRTPLEESLAGIWADVLRVERVGIHDNFFELGGHSLLAVRLFSKVAELLGDRPPLAALFRAPTIAQLAELLQKGQEPVAASPVVVTLQTGGNKRPFFCVPDVAGLGFVFVDLARHLGAERPFYALQSRGLSGQMIHTSIEAMAADYVEGMQTIQPHGPYMLGGFSMGGSVAYEMACQLRARGEEVALLAMFDSACTAFTERPKATSDWDALTALMGIQLDGGTLERLIRCQPEELTDDDVSRVIASGLIPPGVGFEEMRLLLDIFKANFEAVWRYKPQPQPCRISFFRASEPSSSHPLGMHCGWGNLAPVDVHVVPGFHHNMVREPHAPVLAERLRACFETVEQPNVAARHA